jgi:hypothetical protein
LCASAPSAPMIAIVTIRSAALRFTKPSLFSYL